MSVRVIRDYLPVILLCLLGVSSCQKKQVLYLVENKGLYGYVNNYGDTIVKCEYPMAYTDTITRIGFVATKEGVIKCFDYRGISLFDVFSYDNGPDYPSEGLFRILDDKGMIGFADTLGKIIIPPQYKFAYPSENGKAKVTNGGELIRDTLSLDLHETWKSDSWFFIPTKNIRP